MQVDELGTKSPLGMDGQDENDTVANSNRCSTGINDDNNDNNDHDNKLGVSYPQSSTTSITIPTGMHTDDDDDIKVAEAAVASSSSSSSSLKEGRLDNNNKKKKNNTDNRNSTVLSFITTNESVRFAARMTVAMTIASLFVLLNSPVPEPFFIQITAGVVCWQSTSGVGAVMKKAWQRSLGTIIGGLIGLGVGAISLPIEESYGTSQQALYLGIMTVIVNFGMVYTANEMGFRSHYSAVLGTLTAGFVTLAFYNKQGEDAWTLGVFRITNIILGGLIASVSCLIVFPQSTKRLIETEMESQCTMTGKAAKEVLSMAVKHNDGDDVPSYQEMVQHDIQDDAHKAYTSAIFKVKDVKGMFALLQYDPLFRRLDKDSQKKFESMNRVKLGRLLRTQMNVFHIDNLIRSGMMKNTSLNSDLLNRVGENIATILDRSNPQSLLDETAIQLLKYDLPEVKNETTHHVQQRHESGHFHQTTLEDTTLSDEDMFGILGNFQDNPKGSKFIDTFFGLEADMLYRQVETLIVRCLRLHHLWSLKELPPVKEK